MYTETLHPFFQDFCQEIQLLELEDLCRSHKSRLCSSISEYDMGGEGDLFKAPEPIIEEQVVSFNPILDAMTAAASMVTCVDDVMPTQGLSLGDGDSLQDGQFLNGLLFETKKDLLGNMSAEMPIIEHPATSTNEMQTGEKNLIAESAFQKSVSSGCLSSMEWVSRNLLKPGFLDFSELDFGADYGMRRAFSEGDIKRPPGLVSCTAEDRQQKLCRYREKKSRRNFGRKIKYACRKALADSQPRIRGRFAKTEESDHLKRY